MAVEEVTCRVRVQKPHTAHPKELVELSLEDCPDIPIETRLKWAGNTIALIADANLPEAIRPWDLLLHLDGTVSTLPVPAPKGSVPLEYPARYRIPPSSLYGYHEKESVKRAESFALGSLLYEIETGRTPFEGLSDSEVQRFYCVGDFPPDVSRLKLGSTVYSSWSWEFLEEFNRLGKSALEPC
jgi:serine/threonine protein kinase